MDSKELDIWKKACSGDVDSFELIFRIYHPRLFSFCYDLLADSERAKDLVQDCFITLWRHLPSIRQPESSVTYMYTILRNLCKSEVRRRIILADFQDNALELLKEAELDWFFSEPDALEKMYYEELLVQWNKAMDSLPERCRQVVRMRKEDGMSNKEIAEILNISVRTVEDEVYKGIKSIRLKLKGLAFTLICLCHLI